MGRTASARISRILSRGSPAPGTHSRKEQTNTIDSTPLSMLTAKRVCDNGVTVGFGALRGAAAGNTATSFNVDASGSKITTALNPTGQNITVTIDPSKNKDVNSMAVTAAHEGVHVVNGSALVGALPMNLASPDATSVLAGPLNLAQYFDETRAYEASSFMGQGLRFGNLSTGGFEIWNSGWRAADIQTLRSKGINGVLADPKGLYGVTADAPGKKIIQ